MLSVPVPQSLGHVAHSSEQPLAMCFCDNFMLARPLSMSHEYVSSPQLPRILPTHEDHVEVELRSGKQLGSRGLTHP